MCESNYLPLQQKSDFAPPFFNDTVCVLTCAFSRSAGWQVCTTFCRPTGTRSGTRRSPSFLSFA